ncbi:MAG: bifunctional diaminohydroxyphosphoribosylaminopyrimidine deaminase/5-amino-6-(5-phosphoribosylamino)uracil reductase RibD [Algoriphagus sp.]|uniref:bifunctional diaminohydroxyphosphoribosylaminopyrimidine deaminase/5-amino-6-(5-phosphoribosylamino)uracil reductase RibD n=1 Tax=Algoriphagus sp. TaxID=1872435 RepID=UPI0017F84C17|nr:bifunctional diaminohydroxyphosphoribosylaminopyrimidine deaminase/5-amino-6-(5-phosphoribosylamino)uracil reductase RibD [Algoriphagus sp.]NVJ86457.1 bifunctional diaminohydroxyphosphoribosylaminopyrimidine deaminase/5-amino-6-(5-phosphoribosylamino)uracil reductase RibD [Algoriphagus sp.]
MENPAAYMRRALELAELGKGSVSPNPMVGCVIVADGKIIGEGYHQQYGGPHAEVHAVNSVQDSSLFSKATVYVTLEPCAHFGKTPPCANLLVQKGVKKVVIAAMDSNPLVGGKGVEILKRAGIEVETGLLEQEARTQNRRFFTQIEQNRPYVILKWAQTADGFVARKDFSSKWISNALSRQLVHRWRGEEDAILVGKNTAAYDNPSLNVRDWEGKDPIRIVLDPELSLDPGLKLFDRNQATICYNTLKTEESENLAYVQVSPEMHPSEILTDLKQRKIQSVLIEGGAFILKKFLNAELWDEARVFTSQVRFGEGIAAPVMPIPPSSQIQLEDDLLSFYIHG